MLISGDEQRTGHSGGDYGVEEDAVVEDIQHKRPSGLRRYSTAALADEQEARGAAHF